MGRTHYNNIAFETVQCFADNNLYLGDGKPKPIRLRCDDDKRILAVYCFRRFRPENNLAAMAQSRPHGLRVLFAGDC